MGILVQSVALVGICAAVAWFIYDGSLFSYHPVLMSTAYLAFMGNGVLVARVADKGPISERKASYWRHMILTGLGVMLATAGGAAIYLNKEGLGKEHLTSIHGMAGAATTMVAMGISMGGSAIFFKLIPTKLLGAVKKVHRMGGRIVFVMGSIAAASGLQPFNPGHPVNRGTASHVMAGFTVLAAVATVFGPIPKPAAALKAE
mmetsp:Transcript_38260/g.108170  ORF Transcript_38260/g.108170 Transcript_38260/m.108170 type:complete len:203 (+) Transcript_38260:117-725(+)|eukprot:CAMPEP_0117658074 /NCGR_PEP_ID=MMETSP0804-20121206/5669_1 /TAXON_ID=1074897 /ORGANISM="Tetraselmis astigmatica, Strain CCMP880" /LENGTH=202 /DNA_ID=CAMNT_0005464569 /DNA_START=114 /DNA_END=722 /DNA_ORIENTATION=+